MKTNQLYFDCICDGGMIQKSLQLAVMKEASPLRLFDAPRNSEFSDVIQSVTLRVSGALMSSELL
jgi:hypothetical protein